MTSDEDWPHSKMVVIVEPVPKGRPRIGKNGNIYTSHETRIYEEMIAWHSKEMKRFEGDLFLGVTFWCSPNKLMPDLDNLIKAICDGLQKGGAIENDRQIAELHAYRKPATECSPRVAVTLGPMELP